MELPCGVNKVTIWGKLNFHETFIYQKSMYIF